ncbi:MULTISPECIES: GtrA family protein [unclassified Gordonia (in: high G+C Gram-positive bacteria)]|uniref:GtrA family protein n=1 Tax=unclassified Gordonia (in: high G+C Gram-positive bacteria) TaxID=2657482 RepID=UPI001F0E70A2|nr:GtrA family protein [Gordonia sp. ABSL49_1]MCH5643644.1 GtrA family protein [Gordonia sp. ABSL49_1]
MPFIDELVARLPGPVRRLAMRHHELIKFALVGGTTFVFDLAIFYLLTFTVLETKPVIARVISGTLATILSYILNREWAFKNRGGRERHHEALLFFAISGIGVILAAAPLFLANNVFDVRDNLSAIELAVVDFILGFIIGNILQMAFRFWALRKFAFPEEKLRGGDAGSTDLHASLAELNDEELGHA